MHEELKASIYVLFPFTRIEWLKHIHYTGGLWESKGLCRGKFHSNLYVVPVSLFRSPTKTSTRQKKNQDRQS